jgi:hypothetical protein
MRKLAEAAAAGGKAVHYLGLGEGEQMLHVAVQAAARSSSIALTLTSPQLRTTGRGRFALRKSEKKQKRVPWLKQHGC